MTPGLREDRPSASLPALPALPALVEPGPELTREEAERYSRNVMLAEIGTLGQRRLARARVLVIGAGGLGSPVLMYLAAAGVGTLGIVDDDVVEASNLQRQIVHSASDVGRLKVESAREAIARAHPSTRVDVHPLRLTSGNALELLGRYDLVIDGADNFATRYVVNDAAALLGKPYVWGSLLRFSGQVSVFWGRHGPTYRDLYPEPPIAGTVPTCGESGVLGALCGVIGSLMAVEAVKLITGAGASLLGRLLTFDALDASWREVGIGKDPGAAPVTELVDYEAFCGAYPAGSGGGDAAGVAAGVSAGSSVGSSADISAGISARELDRALRARAAGEREFDLIDVREPGEHAVVHIPGARLVPLREIAAGRLLESVPPEREVVLYCKLGPRALDARELLARAGYRNVRTLTGGVIAWVNEIEPEKSVY